MPSSDPDTRSSSIRTGTRWASRALSRMTSATSRGNCQMTVVVCGNGPAHGADSHGDVPLSACTCARPIASRHEHPCGPARNEWVAALSRGDAEFSEQFSLPVEPGWQGFRRPLPLLIARSQDDERDRWGPHLFFDADGALVGNGGWKGAPVGGRAELGYAVAPRVRGRGIAGAAVRVLLARGRQAGLHIAVAHTLAEESAFDSGAARLRVHEGGRTQPSGGRSRVAGEIEIATSDVT